MKTQSQEKSRSIEIPMILCNSLLINVRQMPAPFEASLHAQCGFILCQFLAVFEPVSDAQNEDLIGYGHYQLIISGYIVDIVC